jgi:CheY-like chemotaxis protein
MECPPGCFYPTEVIFVDDSESYLQMLSLFFKDIRSILLKTFKDPQEALAYIKTRATAQQQINWEQENCFTPNCYALKLNVFSLHKQIYNPHRYAQISVVIADYDLTEKCMDGIEFCRRIDDKNIQKILFTGQTDREFVIQAFNEGIIQQYLPKSNVKNIKDILDIIKAAQSRYFMACTASLDVALRSDQRFPLALHSKKFHQLFNRIIEQHNIIEYYLLDGVGSFLLVDGSNKTQLLVVQNEDQVSANCLELQDEISNDKLEALKEGKFIYYNTLFWNNNPQHAYQALIPSETLTDGPHKFFYGITESKEAFDRDRMVFLS